MKAIYPVIFTEKKDKKDTVLVNVPDLDVQTEGYGMVDAINMARDLIALQCVYLEDKGEAIPSPSKANDIDVSRGMFFNSGENTVSLMDVDTTVYRKKMDNKSVRRNVTLPNWLNQEAELAKINVSKVLQKALMETLGLTE